MSRKRNSSKDDACAYYLRGIPSDLWEPVMAKAQAEGRTVRWVILHALRDWLYGVYEPGRHPDGHDQR